jgi:hypothetical protein
MFHLGTEGHYPPERSLCFGTEVTMDMASIGVVVRYATILVRSFSLERN